MRKPSPFGGRWPRPRPRPDEGRVCRNHPFTRCIGKLCPHQSAYADSFSPGRSLLAQKRGRFRVLFFTYTHIFGVPTQ